jgi:hypothetical protein
MAPARDLSALLDLGFPAGERLEVGLLFQRGEQLLGVLLRRLGGALVRRSASTLARTASAPGSPTGCAPRP